MEYNFRAIEAKWQEYWAKNKTYAPELKSSKPKFYVLDMFPYPSGAGLHVGHPLGYIASDVYARYKRLKGFNVLHPMGYDSFGLPAEQYAIQTGQHPAITTKENIARYREQLDKLGFSFDWDREVRTSDPSYYKWTQWIFIQLFKHWYNNYSKQAEPINKLISIFEKEGNAKVNATTDQEALFTAAEWKAMSEEEQQKVLLNYRLTFLSETEVNWCPALGTVLANDEVKEGVSERGGHPVVRKKMEQWSMRITAYAERLLNDLEELDWSDALKEQQRNWIGRSEGASVRFQLEGHTEQIEVFTTRPDTIFGVTFLVLAPEHELVAKITTKEYKAQVEGYIEETIKRSERDRMSDVKTVSGQFTGAHVIHPFTGDKVQVWIGDYVLAGYGTGAVMAVPCGDQRDWDFAHKFGIKIISLIKGQDVAQGADPTKDGMMINSDFLNGMTGRQAIPAAVAEIEKRGFGKGKINYRLRDAIFSRQRYWGEPIPVYYKNGIPYVLEESELPLELPEVDKYLPTEDGEPPLARATKWQTKEGYPLECNTMPGWAGSSWYFFRYMDAINDKVFASKESLNYWKKVDLYIGGSEHATGHLLYSRFWTKFLFDMGLVPDKEYSIKLINQGMILGRSNFVYRIKNTSKFVSKGLKDLYDTTAIHVDVNMVENDILDIEKFKKWRAEYANAEFELESGKYICGYEVEKMSKSKYNVVNPDDIVERFGADTLRLYEMFLGPLEQAKPWDTKGIDGVHRFLKKLWRLFYHEGQLIITNDEPSKEELKSLHKAIKGITEDIERYSFNTPVSKFMIAVNELGDLKCHKKSVLEPFLILLSSYAPHISEELWSAIGYTNSIVYSKLPSFNPSYLVEDAHTYPVSFNGKMRFKIELPANMSKEDVEKEVLTSEEAQKWLEGKPPKKIIVVPKKIVNVVV